MTYKSIILDNVPLQLKGSYNLPDYHDKSTCNVIVKYCLYNRKKKIILKVGESRANSKTLSKISIHAEERAIKDCLKYDPKNKCDIYIWKYGRGGNIKKKCVCASCEKLIKKYNFCNRVFTFEDGNIVSALDNKSVISLGNIIRNS